MTDPQKEPQEDPNQSFWMPGNYVDTVQRTQNGFQVCEDIVACFKDRARVEKRYAQQLKEWSSKWKSIADSRPLYGSLMRAFQSFFSSAERLSVLHSSISHSLVSEDEERIHSWQKEAFQRKMFYGFRETYDLETAFARVQKPWVKKLKKLESAQHAHHKSCEKELSALDKERQAKHNPKLKEHMLAKIQQAREKATQDRDKARERYEKVLEDVTGYAPRYMEEMEAVFDQSQEQERKRISFLKQTFLSIHRHLDVTNNDRCASEWVPPVKKKKHGKKPKPLTGDGKTVMIGGVRVKALYDYVGEEADELSFKAGEEFLKVEEEDEQGWCRGVKEGGPEGFYPANYAQVVQ
ncbi:protein kinase C and casein kinase substrate in neurons protein 2 [Pygocentrus nattereri]|uniref:protein kinase C and casein kinase substrate in neurons protein 2 n=1 Tax=Pygocentrus nattereri TaxID=42514 RepID=UPI0018910798|nr:protein kinase C and casein kinase substrate in neurons protein 2 [Pygocentrus nattereri]